MKLQADSSQFGFWRDHRLHPSLGTALCCLGCQWCTWVKPGLFDLWRTGQGGTKRCSSSARGHALKLLRWEGATGGAKLWGTSSSSEDLTIFLVFSTPSRKTAGGHTLLRDWSGKSLNFKSNIYLAEGHAAFLNENQQRLIFNACLFIDIYLFSEVELPSGQHTQSWWKYLLGVSTQSLSGN